MKTNEFDGRRLDHKTRENIRIRAVKLVEQGQSPEQVVKALGFHRSCIYEWLAKYREGGRHRSAKNQRDTRQAQKAKRNANQKNLQHRDVQKPAATEI